MSNDLLFLNDAYANVRYQAGMLFLFDANGNPIPLDRIISVTGFGAKGNGVTDDTAALQAAVTVAGNIRGGGIVYFPPGQYLITKQIDILRACHIFARPWTANIYFGVPNINGFVVGDGTQPTNVLATGTRIVGLQFAALNGVAPSNAGACIKLNNVNYAFITDVSIQGKSTVTQLWNGIEIVNSIEWTVDRPLIQNLNNQGIRCVGALGVTCGDGRIESPECTGCGASSGGAGIYFGDYTGAITVDSCIMDSNYGWGIQVDCTQAAGVGANYFIMFPDIEASLPTNPPGGICVKQGTAQIVGGWLGGTAGLQVDALGSSVTMQAVINQANIPAVVSGAACSFLDCDFAGPLSIAGPTGIVLNAGASDTNIVGGRIRQFVTEGIKFVGNPVRCNVSGVNFRSNGANATGDAYAGGLAASPPQFKGCSDGNATAFVAASTLEVRHGMELVSVSGAAAINNIRQIGCNSRITIIGGAVAPTLNHSGSLVLKGAVNAVIPTGATMDLVCDGWVWRETARSF